MKRLILLISLLTLSVAAFAQNIEGTYTALQTKYSFKTLVIGPDTFKNRFRFWFVDDSGTASVYEVAQKVTANRYKIISNDDNYLLVKEDRVEIHHVGSTGWVDVFKRVRE